MQTVHFQRTLVTPSAEAAVSPAVKLSSAAKPALQTPFVGSPAKTEGSGLKVAVPVDQWIKLCGFSPLNQKQTLQAALDAAKTAMTAYLAGRGLRPMAILDIDDTTMRTAPRTGQILKEWLAATPMPKEIHDKLAAVQKTSYENADTFASAGLDIKDPQVKPLFDQFSKFWKDRFFTSAYLKYDVAQADAIAFVNALLEIGCDVAYVTGRDEPNMGQGTRDSLRDLGFPVPAPRQDPSSPEVSLHLKAKFEDPDAPFKFDTATKLSKKNNVVLTVDNSPGNVVALKDALPNAINIFINTVYGKGPYELRDGLYKVDGFARD